MKTPKVLRQSWSAEIQREWSAGYAPSVQVRLPNYFLSFPPAMPFAEQEAAAHIIGAAPDAIDALRLVLPYAESRLEDMAECVAHASPENRSAAAADHARASEAFKLARAAIAKAEGRA